MTLYRATKIIQKEFKRIKLFKEECNSCVDDDLIEAIDYMNEIFDSFIGVIERLYMEGKYPVDETKEDRKNS